MCGCCHGRRSVPDIDGNPRPCSRCRSEEFNRWSAARYPVRVPVGPPRSEGSTLSSDGTRDDEQLPT